MKRSIVLFTIFLAGCESSKVKFDFEALKSHQKYLSSLDWETKLIENYSDNWALVELYSESNDTSHVVKYLTDTKHEKEDVLLAYYKNFEDSQYRYELLISNDDTCYFYHAPKDSLDNKIFIVGYDCYLKRKGSIQ